MAYKTALINYYSLCKFEEKRYCSYIATALTPHKFYLVQCCSQVVDAGCNAIVAGSAVFKAQNYGDGKLLIHKFGRNSKCACIPKCKSSYFMSYLIHLLYLYNHINTSNTIANTIPLLFYDKVPRGKLKIKIGIFS